MAQGISPNPLNDISKVYLDLVSKINKDEEDKIIQKWDDTSVNKVDPDLVLSVDSTVQKEGKLTSVKATTYGMLHKERQVLIDKERERQGVKPKPTKEEFSNWRDELGYEGKDDSKKLQEDDMKGMSVKSGHKRPTKAGAGMTKKGVEAYRRRNPGSKLKTAVTTKPSKLKKGSKAANRRKSYCARSAGQMKKFPKAARDPNSRLRQARKRWKC